MQLSHETSPRNLMRNGAHHSTHTTHTHAHPFSLTPCPRGRLRRRRDRCLLDGARRKGRRGQRSARRRERRQEHLGQGHHQAHQGERAPTQLAHTRATAARAW
eukprot:6198364-Pleurochrysis_carterae.AAC.1